MTALRRGWRILAEAAGRHGLALALFTAVAVASLAPLSTRPMGRLPDNADALSCAWAVAFVCHQAWNDPWHLTRANMFHPDPAALFYQDPMIGPALLAAPALLLGASATLAYNLLLVATLVLVACGAYLLVLELVPSRAAAIVGGLAFAFTTANYDSLARIQILSSQWTPFTLVFVLRLLRHGRLRDGLLAGACFALQGLSSNYYALFFATLLVGACPWLWALVPRPRRAHVPWRGLLAGLALAGTLLVPLAWAQQAHLSRLHGVRVLRPGALPGSSWQQTLPSNWLYGRVLGLDNVAYDDRYFPGCLPPMLALLGLVVLSARWRTRFCPATTAEAGHALRFLLVFGLLAFLLGCGRTLPLPWGGEWPGPYAWLHAHVPGYAATRVPSRFVMFARLALCVSAALGVAVLLARLRSGWPRRLAWALLVVLLPLEHWATPLRTWELPEGRTLPAAYGWLRGLPSNTVILEYPPAPPRGRRSEALWLLLSTHHWQRLVNGYSSFQPAQHALVLDQALGRLPTRGSIAVLRRLGVEYLVLHPDWSRNFPESEQALQRFEQEARRFPADLQFVTSFDDAGIYDGPLGRLGGERVWRLLPGALPPLPARLTPATRLAAADWTCSSKPADGGCERAIDGSLATAFSTARGQRDGDFVRLDFPGVRRVTGVALRVGGWPSSYPRQPDVLGLRDGRWQRLAGRYDAAAFLDGLLARYPGAGLELTFEPAEVSALQIRLGPPPENAERWMQAEIEVHGPPQP